MTYCEQKCSIISFISVCFVKRGLFSQENNQNIFIKIRSKIDKELDFRILVLKRPFNQITLNILEPLSPPILSGQQVISNEEREKNGSIPSNSLLPNYKKKNCESELSWTDVRYRNQILCGLQFVI